MNIIMVCESATLSGGAEKVAIRESVELRKRGIRVGYIAAGREAEQELIDAGVETLLLDTKSFFEETNRNQKIQKMFWNAAIEPEVTRFFAQFPADQTVVHLHSFRLKLSGIVAHMAQKLGFATVIHCHDYTPVCPTSLLYDHRLQTNCERRPMSFSCMSCECQNQPWKYKLPKLTSFFWNQSVWKINHRTRGLIHISQLEKRTINDRVGKPITAFNVPPLGEAKTAARVIAEANESFLFIGRLTPEKGVRTFLAAAQRAGISAVVIGDGPMADELRQEFPSARFTGWLGQAQLMEELRKARALAVPSVWRETLCLSVIDAMQQGVPCIVSENVGAKEFIESGRNGVIFAEGRLEEAIAQFADNEFVSSLSQAAYQTFLEKPPTIERHVDALLDIYSSCLGSQSI